MGEASVADRAAKRAAIEQRAIDARLDYWKKHAHDFEVLPVDKINDLIKRRVAAWMAKDAWEKKAETMRRFPMKVVEEIRQESVEKRRQEEAEPREKERQTAEAKEKAAEAARVLEEEKQRQRAERR